MLTSQSSQISNLGFIRYLVLKHIIVENRIKTIPLSAPGFYEHTHTFVHTYLYLHIHRHMTMFSLSLLSLFIFYICLVGKKAIDTPEEMSYLLSKGCFLNIFFICLMCDKTWLSWNRSLGDLVTLGI